jgi:hypothetical protein
MKPKKSVRVAIVISLICVVLTIFTVSTVARLRYLARINQISVQNIQISPLYAATHQEQLERQAYIVRLTKEEMERLRSHLDIHEEEDAHASAPQEDRAERGLMRRMLDEVMSWFGVKE